MKSPRIHLKIKKNNGKTKIYHSLKTKRIYAIVKADNFKKCTLRVVYDKDIDNSITGNKDDILWGIDAFLDKYLYI